MSSLKKLSYTVEPVWPLNSRAHSNLCTKSLSSTFMSSTHCSTLGVVRNHLDDTANLQNNITKSVQLINFSQAINLLDNVIEMRN